MPLRRQELPPVRPLRRISDTLHVARASGF